MSEVSPTIKRKEYEGHPYLEIVTWKGQGNKWDGVTLGLDKAKMVLREWSTINAFVTSVDRGLPFPPNTAGAEMWVSEFKDKRNPDGPLVKAPVMKIVTARSRDGSKSYGTKPFGVKKALAILRFKAEIEEFVGKGATTEPTPPPPPDPEEDLPF